MKKFVAEWALPLAFGVAVLGACVGAKQAGVALPEPKEKSALDDGITLVLPALGM